MLENTQKERPTITKELVDWLDEIYPDKLSVAARVADEPYQLGKLIGARELIDKLKALQRQQIGDPYVRRHSGYS